jgi:hypothetical protein
MRRARRRAGRAPRKALERAPDLPREPGRPPLRAVVGEQIEERREIARLQQEVTGAGADRLVTHAMVGGEHGDRNVRELRVVLLRVKEVFPAHVRKPPIEQDEAARRAPAKERQALGARPDGVHVEAVEVEDHGERVAGVGVVFDQKDEMAMLRHGAGFAERRLLRQRERRSAGAASHVTK